MHLTRSLTGFAMEVSRGERESSWLREMIRFKNKIKSFYFFNFFLLLIIVFFIYKIYDMSRHVAKK
jgi:tRNA U38,U39,U40 pseudouridine synthase TruA